MIYVGYAKGGKSIDYTLPIAEGEERIREHNEFIVERQLKELGIDVWVGRRLFRERRGKDRRARFYEEPYLRNYVFLDLTMDNYYAAIGHKLMHSTLMAVAQGERAGLERFKAAVAAEYEQEDRIRRNGEAVAEYTPGQALRQIGGMFEGRLLRFKGMVQRASDIHLRIQAETEMFGRTVLVETDPLDVKAAE